MEGGREKRREAERERERMRLTDPCAKCLYKYINGISVPCYWIHFSEKFLIFFKSRINELMEITKYRQFIW